MKYAEISISPNCKDNFICLVWKKDEAVIGLKFIYWFLSFARCLNAENVELLASTAARSPVATEHRKWG